MTSPSIENLRRQLHVLRAQHRQLQADTDGLRVRLMISEAQLFHLRQRARAWRIQSK